MKTTKDVLEKWPDGWPYDKYDCAVLLSGIYSGASYIELWNLNRETFENTTMQVICTREQYEQARREKMEEQKYKMLGSSDVVKIKYEGRDGIVCVANNDNDIWVIRKSDLKPIKPKLTKAQAWDMIHKKGDCLLSLYGEYENIIDNYDITD